MLRHMLRRTFPTPRLRALAERWGDLSEEMRQAVLRVAGVNPHPW